MRVFITHSAQLNNTTPVQHLRLRAVLRRKFNLNKVQSSDAQLDGASENQRSNLFCRFFEIIILKIKLNIF